MATPLSLAKSSARSERASRTRAAFVEAVEALKQTGVGLRELARILDCDVRTLSDIRDGKRPVYDWAIGGLPPLGKQVFSLAIKALEHPEFRTGTEG